MLNYLTPIFLELTSPTAEPVSVQDLKTHLRLQGLGNAEDGMLSDFIVSARLEAESRSQLVLIERSFLAILPRFQDHILLRRPLVSVTQIQYRDTAGTLQTVDAGTYYLPTGSHEMVLRWDKTWPVDVGTWDDAVQITHVAGIGTDPADVPQDIRLGIKLRAGDRYMNREATSPLSMNRVSHDPAMIYDRYRRRWL